MQQYKCDCDPLNELWQYIRVRFDGASPSRSVIGSGQSIALECSESFKQTCLIRTPSSLRQAALRVREGESECECRGLCGRVGITLHGEEEKQGQLLRIC